MSTVSLNFFIAYVTLTSLASVIILLIISQNKIRFFLIPSFLERSLFQNIFIFDENFVILRDKTVVKQTFSSTLKRIFRKNVK